MNPMHLHRFLVTPLVFALTCSLGSTACVSKSTYEAAVADAKGAHDDARTWLEKARATDPKCPLIARVEGSIAP